VLIKSEQLPRIWTRNYSEGRGANCQGGQQAAQALRFLVPGLSAPALFGRLTDGGPRSTATNSASGTPVRRCQHLISCRSCSAG
jgi:hypothetical protein